MSGVVVVVGGWGGRRRQRRVVTGESYVWADGMGDFQQARYTHMAPCPPSGAIICKLYQWIVVSHARREVARPETSPCIFNHDNGPFPSQKLCTWRRPDVDDYGCSFFSTTCLISYAVLSGSGCSFRKQVCSSSPYGTVRWCDASNVPGRTDSSSTGFRTRPSLFESRMNALCGVEMGVASDCR